jgi:hypothetical protein
MLHEPTREKLMKLRLSAMAEAWETQGKDPKLNDLTFDERFGLLVDVEYLARHNRKLSRLLKDAQLRISGACIEDVDTTAVRGLDKAFVRQLGTCAWIGDHRKSPGCPTWLQRGRSATPSA